MANGEVGRASKLPKFFEAMKEVLDDPNSLLLTDKELWIATNYKLHRDDKIGLSTFEFWKSPTIGAKSPEKLKTVDAELIEDFRETIAYARVKQKMNLTSNMMDKTNKNNWADVKLMEWKFKDLLPAHNVASNQQPLIQITATNDNHKKLIDNILNGEPIHLKPAEEVEEPYSSAVGFEEVDFNNPQIDNE